MNAETKRKLRCAKLIVQNWLRLPYWIRTLWRYYQKEHKGELNITWKWQKNCHFAGILVCVEELWYANEQKDVVEYANLLCML